jgi:hypothetical protein
MQEEGFLQLEQVITECKARVEDALTKNDGLNPEDSPVPALVAKILDQERSNFSEILRDEESIYAFIESENQYARSEFKVSFATVTQWLFVRSRQIGVRPAFKLFHQFVETGDVFVELTTLLTSVILETSLQITERMWLVPFPSYYDPYPGPIVEDLHRTQSSLYSINAVLVVWSQVTHDTNNPQSASYGPTDEDIADAKNALDCVCVLGLGSAQPLGSSVASSLFHSTRDGGTVISHVPTISHYARLENEALHSLPDLFQRLRRMRRESMESYTKVEAALHRFANAMNRELPSDRAIDLGTVLEILFTDKADGRDNITHRLRLRVARYLGKSFDERVALDERVNRLYKLRSDSVHTGKLELNEKSESALLDGTRLASQALTHFICNGVPDNWKQVELG